MKKVAAFLLTIVLVLCVCGCSQYKCRDEAKKYGESAIFYAEQYIDGVITVEKARENISIISDELEDYCDTTHNDTLKSDMKLCESTLSLAVRNLYFEFYNEEYTGGQIADIKETVEDIKKYISY